MSTTTSRQRLAADTLALERAESLLLAYPAISDEEVGEVARFLTAAPPLDLGLLSSNKAAWAAGEQLRRDHPAYFRTSKWTVALWILAALALTALLVTLWDSGLRH